MVKAAKDKRDIYYRLAKEQGFRARSAFKLLQIDEAYGLLGPQTRRVVDLCAAPGSWSQVIVQRLRENTASDRTLTSPVHQLEGVTTAQDALLAIQQHDVEARQTHHAAQRTPVLVSVDLQPMAPLDKLCVMLQADITTESTLRRIVVAFEKAAGDDSIAERMAKATIGEHASSQAKADLVVSDGAPDVTGMHDLDIYLQHQLLLSALTLATCLLRPGGAFVAKIFKRHDLNLDGNGGVHGLSNHSSGDASALLLIAQAKLFFKRVTLYKPTSSRASSLEHFIVCEGFAAPADFVPSLARPLSVPVSALSPEVDGTNGKFADFLALGDLSMYNKKHGVSIKASA